MGRVLPKLTKAAGGRATKKQARPRGELPPPRSPSRQISSYHAHVYYDPETTRSRAERLRQRVATEFPRAKLGRWHDELVGPHTQSMYQVAFPSRLLASFVPWLMQNRDGLTVLLHPETGDDYSDHTAHACWFGAVLPLHVAVLRRGATR